VQAVRNIAGIRKPGFFIIVLYFMKNFCEKEGISNILSYI